MAHMARRAADFGIHVGEVRVDFQAAMARVHAIVDASREGLARSLEKGDGITLVRERAAFAGRDGAQFVVRSASTRVVASRVYLNTGTRPFVPAIAGLDAVPVLTNESILQLTSCPAHLVIVGGSYIGLEFGQIFRRLGSEVTIVEESPSVAAREDEEAAARITAMLTDEGITILAGHAVEQVAPAAGRDDAEGVRVRVRAVDGGETREVLGSHLLIATGRVPNSDALELERVGITRNDRGFIPVDGELQTNVAGVWALGDVNGRGAFTHTSYQDHEIVLANYLGGARSVDDRVMTYAMYTDPPLGRVGINEREARAQQQHGRHFLVAHHEMERVSRAEEEGETIGELRVIVDAETRRFEGASLLGIRCDEVVQVIGAMMAADAPYDILRDALPIHPTVTEFFPTILGKLRPLE
jgi:pyruvate/2-oxoglutarate dehydrogenase complex dihydrolipoamide dehydrogenase (E3) component